MALTKINASVIANNTIAVGNIADNSVDATKIASNSILTRHIDDDQITGDQLADNVTIAGVLTATSISVGDSHTIGNDGFDNLELTSSTSENIVLKPAGSVYLYNAGAAKLVTTSSGIDVTGTVTADGLTVDSGTTNTVATFTSTDAGAGVQLTDPTGSSKLETSGANLRISVDDDGAVGSSAIQFRVDGSTKATINSSGGVGIGVGDADELLHILGSSAAPSPVVKIQSDDTADATSSILFMSRLADNSNKNVTLQAYRGNLSITGDSGYGNIGVGVTSPDGLLHVKGATNKTIKIDSTFSSGTHTSLAFARNGTDKWRVFQNSADEYLSFYNDGNSTYQFSLGSNGKIWSNINPANFSSYASLGDFIFQQSLDDLGIGVIDDNATNTFKMINNGTEAKIAYNAALPIRFYTSDTTKQLELHNSGAIKSASGGMVLQTKQEYNGTAASVSGNATTTVIGMDITVKEGSKVAVWFHSGQILNNSTSANPNGHLQHVIGGTVTNITNQNHNHYWWDQTDNIDRQFFSTQGMSGTLSAGTYNIRFLGGTYSGTTTWNYQSQGSHLIVQEIAAN